MDHDVCRAHGCTGSAYVSGHPLHEETVTPQEMEGAEDSLKWAARTYLVAALGSLAQLLYYASMLLGGSRREE